MGYKASRIAETTQKINLKSLYCMISRLIKLYQSRLYTLAQCQTIDRWKRSRIAETDTRTHMAN